MKKRNILITESDMKRLKPIVESSDMFFAGDRENFDALEQELDRADVVATEKAPENLVTMNSQVRVRDLDAGAVSVYTLVFPQDADASRNKISVLAPIGTALLGYRVGEMIECRVPAGTKKLKVEAVLYQPEAVGVAA